MKIVFSNSYDFFYFCWTEVRLKMTKIKLEPLEGKSPMSSLLVRLTRKGRQHLSSKGLREEAGEHSSNNKRHWWERDVIQLCHEGALELELWEIPLWENLEEAWRCFRHLYDRYLFVIKWFCTLGIRYWMYFLWL